MNVVEFHPNDLNDMISLFQESVRSVGKSFYSSAQLKAWAPDFIHREDWLKRFESSYTILVKAYDGELLGFSNLESDGTIDMIYVHANRQGQGIATMLISELERYARDNNFNELKADVSKIARPFFEARGFLLKSENKKSRLGESFLNYLFYKNL